MLLQGSVQRRRQPQRQQQHRRGQHRGGGQQGGAVAGAEQLQLVQQRRRGLHLRALQVELRGLEAGDTFAIAGADLMIDFRASTPGDSVRVILGAASPSLTFNVCDSQDTTLMGTVTGGGAASAGGVFAQLCEPIGAIGNNNLQSNDLFAFVERERVLLTQALAVEAPRVAREAVPPGRRLRVETDSPPRLRLPASRTSRARTRSIAARGWRSFLSGVWGISCC